MQKTYLFHGPSGSGKDTQIDLLAPLMGFERIATGDMFRTMPGEGHKLAMKVADEVNNHGVFPNGDVVYALLDDWVKRYDRDKNWVLVSLVRLENQIEYFEEFLKKQDRELDLFIHFNLSDEVAIERLSKRWYCPVNGKTYHEIYNPEKKAGFCDEDGSPLERRKDDNPEAIKLRLKQYRDNISPILEHFKQQGKLVEVDASPSIEGIHKIVKTLVGIEE